MRTVRSDGAPAPVGPYSQGVVAGPGELVFVSGQVALDPGTGRVAPGDVAGQTRRVIAQVEAVLHAAGASLADVVKTTVYLTDLAADFPAMNAAYAEAFAGRAPARVTVGVAALPLGALVEVDAMAVVPVPAPVAGGG